MPYANWFPPALAEDWRNGGFGLYVHWPFCEAKCPYCDFNSHVERMIDQHAWRRAYLAEIERAATETEGRVLNSIFFGGGTPSLMEPETVGAIIESAGRHWRLANDVEITLEANPGSVEAGRFAGYRNAGVNRVSLGIQALNDIDLRRLGRIHTVSEARAALDVARRHFERVSFDLIYARQDQTLDDWQRELREALDMAVDHLSLYQLTIEPGTAFGDRLARGGLKGLPNDDLGEALYDATQEMCESAGMPRYEVSNHARHGAQSRHNLIYWHYGDYIGIGPGAHGRITLNGQRFATETPRSPAEWLAAVAHGNGENVRNPLSRSEQAEEYLLMGLRIAEGIDRERYATMAGTGLPKGALTELIDLGMVKEVGSRISVTYQGFKLLNQIIGKLAGA